MTDEFTLQFSIRMPDGRLACSPYNGKPLLWDNRHDVEAALDDMRRHAKQMGIQDWLGVIVKQYVSPFISDDDPGEQLVAELQAWMRTQQGGTR